MADEIVVTAAPSTATEPQAIPQNSKQYQEWRLTGKLPEAKAPTAKSEASPASDTSKETQSEAAPNGEAETSPDSETGTPQESQGKGRGAEDRIRQLVARTKELERKLADSSKPSEAKVDEKPAESSPAKPKEAPKLEAPKRPKLDDFQTYDEYEAARDEFVDKLTDYKAKLAIQEDRQQQRIDTQNKELADKLTNARERYPDADKAIAPAAKAIMDDQNISPVVKALIDDSPVMIDLLYVMGSDETKLREFVTSARTNPGEAIRQLVLMERLVKDELAGNGDTNGGGKARAADGKFASDETPEQKVSKAPKPPHEVGGRGSQPPDEVEGAIKAKDFSAYRAAQNRRDLASRRG